VTGLGDNDHRPQRVRREATERGGHQSTRRVRSLIPSLIHVRVPRCITNRHRALSRARDRHGQPWTVIPNPEKRKAGGSTPPLTTIDAALGGNPRCVRPGHSRSLPPADLGIPRTVGARHRQRRRCLSLPPVSRAHRHLAAPRRNAPDDRPACRARPRRLHTRRNRPLAGRPGNRHRASDG
jgi:hypothetical protein